MFLCNLLRRLNHLSGMLLLASLLLAGRDVDAILKEEECKSTTNRPEINGNLELEGYC